jgi:hypothetical protein
MKTMMIMMMSGNDEDGNDEDDNDPGEEALRINFKRLKRREGNDGLYGSNNIWNP